MDDDVTDSSPSSHTGSLRPTIEADAVDHAVEIASPKQDEVQSGDSTGPGKCRRSHSAELWVKLSRKWDAYDLLVALGTSDAFLADVNWELTK